MSNTAYAASKAATLASNVSIFAIAVCKAFTTSGINKPIDTH